jgi:hypothetical protein
MSNRQSAVVLGSAIFVAAFLLGSSLTAGGVANAAELSPRVIHGSDEQQDPALPDIINCGLAAVHAPMPDVPFFKEMKDKIEKIQTEQKLADFFSSKNAYGMTPDQWADVALIATGFDSCTNVSPELKTAVEGIAGALAPMTEDPAAPSSGAVLCPGSDPFGPSQNMKFEPNC